MWPNCLKYRQGRSVSCAGFCSVKIRNHLFVDFFGDARESAERNLKMQTEQKSKEKERVFFFCGCVVALFAGPI